MKSCYWRSIKRVEKSRRWSAFNGRHVEEKHFAWYPSWFKFLRRESIFHQTRQHFSFSKASSGFTRCVLLFSLFLTSSGFDLSRHWWQKTNYVQLKVLTSFHSPLYCDATMKNPSVRPCYQNLKFSFPPDNFLATEPRLQRIKRSSGCVSWLESLWEGLEKGRSPEKLSQVLSRKKKKKC